MALNLKIINKLRSEMGQDPLPESGENNTDQSEAAVEADSSEDNKKTISDPVKDMADDAKAVDSKIDDNIVLEYLNKKKGINVSSFEELTPKQTDDELKKEAERKEAEKLSFALNKGITTRKEYESFVLDTQNPQDIVYAQYHADAKKHDPELTDEEIQEEFLADFGLNTEPGTRKHNMGQKKLNVLAEKYLKEKYQKIYSIDDEFSKYENSRQVKSEYDKKILEGAPVYKKDVEDIFSELKKVKAQFSDEEIYEVEVLDDSLNDIKSKMLDAEYAAKHISGGYSKEDLKEIAFSTFLRQNYPALMREVAKQHLLKHQAGTRGIPIKPIQSKKEGFELTEAQKKFKDNLAAEQSVN